MIADTSVGNNSVTSVSRLTCLSFGHLCYMSPLSGHHGWTLRCDSVLLWWNGWSSVLVHSPYSRPDPEPGLLCWTPLGWCLVLVPRVSRAARWTETVPIWTLPLRGDTKFMLCEDQWSQVWRMWSWPGFLSNERSSCSYVYCSPSSHVANPPPSKKDQPSDFILAKWSILQAGLELAFTWSGLAWSGLTWSYLYVYFKPDIS